MATDGGSWNNLPSVILLEVFKYLPRNDTISASSTCKQWRRHLYHAPLWRSLTFEIYSHDKNTIARNRYLASCFARKLRSATVKFDSLDSVCVEEAARVVKKLSKNQDLRKFHLMPSNCRFEFPGDSEGQEQFLESHGLQMLHKIAATSLYLEELTLGCMEDITTYSKELLNLLVLNQSSSLKALGLASLKDDPDDYLLPDLDCSLFQSFRHLQILSMDYDNVDDMLRNKGAKASSSACFQVFTTWRFFLFFKCDAAWKTFRLANPKCELRLSLIHSYDAVGVLHNTVLRPSMPLTHLRAFFCEQINIFALQNVYLWYANSLRSIQWVDSLQSSATNALLDLGDQMGPDPVVPNPLVMCAWRCKKLEEIVLIGYKMWESEVCALFRLRENLRNVVLWEGDILLEELETMEKLEEAVMNEWGRAWKPRDSDHLDEVILNPDNGDSDEYILPLVASDLIA